MKLDMTDDSDRQMTIPELLEARAKVDHQLGLSMGGPFRGTRAPAGGYEQTALHLQLQEIETEFAEPGYKDVEES